MVSDREINYEFNRRYPDTPYFANLNPTAGDLFDICRSRIMEPHDNQPVLPTSNFDGTNSIDLSSSVFVTKQIATAQTESTGFWSATSTSDSATINDYLIDDRRYILSGSVISDDINGQGVISSATGDVPEPGNLVLLRASWPGAAGPEPKTTAPFADFFYRVRTADEGANTMTIDRYLPNFNSDSSSKSYNWYEYPWNGIESYYGSGATENCPVWNLNIVRTSREIGQTEIAIGANIGHSYSSFASREYSGAKQYFGFEDDLRQIGFIHYSNAFTGNTYGEQLVPGTTQVDMPTIMWHRTNVNPGKGELGGQRFTDKGSDVYYDQIARSSYTLLKDGASTSSIVVGRIYTKLKLVVITDPELLTAMSYKTDRNWTLPPLMVGSQPVPQSPATIYNTSGLLRSDYVYYVTYLAENNDTYAHMSSSGYKASMHCGYISKVEGYTDENGYGQYLTCSFASRSFPYLRNGDDFNVFSGTGWSANKVQILVQEVRKSEDKGIDALHPGKWSGASDLLTHGNGVYSGATSHTTIDPSYLQGHQFIIALGDIESGTTRPNYTSGPSNNLYQVSSGFTSNSDFVNTTGLTYGNEDFFFGNIKTKIMSTTYKTVFTIVAKDSEFNSSNNGGFDGAEDPNTYITEIGILNEEGVLVAVGKPTFPIKKSFARYITFQLELDF